MLSALERRVAAKGDPDLLAALHKHTGRILAAAVHGLRAEPLSYSDAEIGEQLGVSDIEQRRRVDDNGADSAPFRCIAPATDRS